MFEGRHMQRKEIERSFLYFVDQPLSRDMDLFEAISYQFPKRANLQIRSHI